MASQTKSSGPVSRLKDASGGLVDALGERATTALKDKVTGAADRLTDYVEGDGGPGLMAALTGAKGMAEGKSPFRSMLGAGFAGAKEKVAGIFRGKGKKAGKEKLKVTNIVESIDVGVPIQVAYNQWTQFGDFPTYMKKIENVDQVEDEKLHWKAQILWSHREWEATILDQHPDERIIWRSEGQKGHVDGAVTFHELTPNLTRIIVVMEYHPQGLFEHTGNLWRAQGRRVRLELKHFERHVMAHALLSPDEIEGWRGVIEDSEVVKDHETAMQEEGSERGEPEDDNSEPRDRDDVEPGEKSGSRRARAKSEDEDEDSGDRERPKARRRTGSGARQASGDKDRPERRSRPLRAADGKSAKSSAGKANGRRRGAA